MMTTKHVLMPRRQIIIIYPLLSVVLFLMWINYPWLWAHVSTVCVVSMTNGGTCVDYVRPSRHFFCCTGH